MKLSEILRQLADTIQSYEEYDPAEVTPDNPVVEPDNCEIDTIMKLSGIG